MGVGCGEGFLWQKLSRAFWLPLCPPALRLGFAFEEMAEFHLTGRGNDPPRPTSPSVLAVRKELPSFLHVWAVSSSSLLSLLYHVFYDKAHHGLSEAGKDPLNQLGQCFPNYNMHYSISGTYYKLPKLCKLHNNGNIAPGIIFPWWSTSILPLNWYLFIYF